MGEEACSVYMGWFCLPSRLHWLFPWLQHNSGALSSFGKGMSCFIIVISVQCPVDKISQQHQRKTLDSVLKHKVSEAYLFNLSF